MTSQADRTDCRHGVCRRARQIGMSQHTRDPASSLRREAEKIGRTTKKTPTPGVQNALTTGKLRDKLPPIPQAWPQLLALQPSGAEPNLETRAPPGTLANKRSELVNDGVDTVERDVVLTCRYRRGLLPIRSFLCRSFARTWAIFHSTPCLSLPSSQPSNRTNKPKRGQCGGP